MEILIMSQPSIHWQQAIALGLSRQKKSPEIFHFVFAQIIEFACTGKDRMSIIKTMRSDLAIDRLFEYGNPGSFKFNQAVLIVYKICYGRITIEHIKKYYHNASGYDTEDDIRVAKAWISRRSPDGKYTGDRDQ